MDGLGLDSPKQTNKFSISLLSKPSAPVSKVELAKAHKWFRVMGMGLQVSSAGVVMGAAQFTACGIRDQQVLPLINHSPLLCVVPPTNEFQGNLVCIKQLLMILQHAIQACLGQGYLIEEPAREG